MDIRVDTSGFKVLEDAWARMPDVVRDEMMTSIVEVDKLLEKEVMDRTPTAVGAGGGLRGSISSEEQSYSDRVMGMVGSPLNYALPVELGTKPHFPPLQPLQDWIKSKQPELSEKEAKSFAYLIARKISRDGTEGKHMFGDAFEANSQQIEKIMAEGVSRIAEKMAEQ